MKNDPKSTRGADIVLRLRNQWIEHPDGVSKKKDPLCQEAALYIETLRTQFQLAEAARITAENKVRSLEYHMKRFMSLPEDTDE